MKLTRERKIYLAALGLGLAVLTVDRALLASPDEAGEPLAVDDPHSLLVAKLQVPGTAASAERLAAATPGPALADRLARAAGSAAGEPLNPMLIRDPFRPRQVAPPQAPVAEAPREPTERAMRFQRFLREHRLTAVLVGTPESGDGGAAIIDGHCVPVGQLLDGFRLVSVDRRSALFDLGGSQLRLALSE